jgi:hypothetical protein
VRLSAHYLLGLLLLASACDQPGAVEPEATRTHALLRIERSAQAGGQPEPSGNAFAAVVRVPELADPEPLLRLSGKTPNLPGAGQCLTTNHERDAVAASDLARAEFLDAGDVLVGANDAQTLLAPRALPLEVLGKVYTSRDRDSAPLPSGAGYLLKTTGSDQLPSLELRVQAPDELHDVAVAGGELSGLSSLSGADEVPITWRAGDARDLVYVEVMGSPDAGSLGVCAFRDADGRGKLPRGLFGASGAGSLSFHRLREVAADVPALDGAEVRFDFALTAQVSYN